MLIGSRKFEGNREPEEGGSVRAIALMVAAAALAASSMAVFSFERKPTVDEARYEHFLKMQPPNQPRVVSDKELDNAFKAVRDGVKLVSSVTENNG